MKSMARNRLPRMAAAILVVLGGGGAGRAAVALTQPAADAAQDDAALRTLTEQFLAAYAHEDLDGFLRLWSPHAPELSERKSILPELFAQYEQIRVEPPLIREVAVEDDRAQVRFEADISAVEALTREPAMGRLWGKTARTLRAVKEEGIWRVWREGTLVEDLARSLVEAPDAEGRALLLASSHERVGTELADALYILGKRQAYADRNLAEALRIYELARQLAEDLSASEQQATIALGVGLIHRDRGDFEAAMEQFRHAAAHFEELGSKEGLAESLWAVATTLSLQGDYLRALESAERSLVLHRETDDRDHKALGSLMELGQDYEALGDFERALATYHEILPLFQKLGRKTGIAYTQASIGQVHYERGDYASALFAHLGALSLLESIGDRPAAATTLVDIGLVHQAQGNYDLALSFFERSRAISEQIGAKADLARTLTRLGDAHRLLGHDGQASALYEQGRALSEALEDAQGTATAWLKIGRLHQDAARYEQALACYRRSLERGESMKSRQFVAESLVGMASAHLAQGDFIDATEAAERAAAIARDLGIPETLWQALTTSGLAARALGRTAQAREVLEQATTAVETMRLRVAGGETDQQRFFESRVIPYQALADLLVTECDPAAALSYSERAKARSLLDVAQGGRASVSRVMTDPERDEERRLNTILVSLNTQVQRERAQAQPDEPRLRDLTERLDKARLEHDSFRSRLYAAHPELKVARGEVRTITLDEAGELAHDGQTALLEYLVGEERSHLFIVTRDGMSETHVKASSLPVTAKELSGRVAAFRQRLAQRQLGFEDEARGLYELLLGPARELLRDKTRLVIVPDGPLWELPFQALEPAHGRFLIEEHAVSYAPSLSVLREMARHQPDGGPRESSTLLAFANPTLEKKAVERAEWVLMGEKLDPLPEAERQARQLRRLYGPKQSRVYIGAEAREDRAKAEAGSYRILHFATHGILDDASPMYSQLVLSPGSTQEDGLLEAREILDLDLNADLAVLSACETARGRVAPGEGVIGLTWAFFVSGCPSTLVSQWKVESESTTELMLEFHRRLRSGRTKTEALQQAALTLLRTPKYRHPFYWAGFVLVGDGS